MKTMHAEHKHVLTSKKKFNVQELEQVIQQELYVHGELLVLMQLILQNLHKQTVYQHHIKTINGHLTINVLNVLI